MGAKGASPPTAFGFHTYALAQQRVVFGLRGAACALNGRRPSTVFFTGGRGKLPKAKVRSKKKAARRKGGRAAAVRSLVY
jgi:hypothetical protein